MPYCTAADVRTMVDTALTDEEIVGIIEMSDAEIDRRIGVQDSSDRLVKKLSMLVTAHSIKTRQSESVAIGEYREDAGNVFEVWEREIERIYRLYRDVSVKASDYRFIEEEKGFPKV
ncbi:MAG TPA: hypothetical protein VM050_05325 [Patescibacteria group bacterium]|nr:hypothetical protein [Patescibacteria group bacterium]